jgi:hypothetical protein
MCRIVSKSFSVFMVGVLTVNSYFQIGYAIFRPSLLMFLSVESSVNVFTKSPKFHAMVARVNATKTNSADITTDNRANGTLDGPGYLTKREVAKRLRKQPRTIERWMKQGIIPHFKIGKGKRANVLFRWPDIEAAFVARFGVGYARN